MQVLRAGDVVGACVPMTDRLALTARHVVNRPRDNYQLRDANGLLHQVTEVQHAEQTDLALLVVDDGLVPVVWRDARDGEAWSATSPPYPNLPYLQGSIEVASRPWADVAGHRLDVMQLNVEQGLADYSGYSGSGVLLPDAENAIAGILIEQQPERAIGTGAKAQRAANVLYGVPIRAALDLFEIPHSATKQPSESTPQDMQLREVRFLASYLSRIVEQLDFVELPGLDLDPLSPDPPSVIPDW